MSSMCYVGRKSCGCVVAAVVDNPERPREVAKDVARFVREGLVVERHTVEEVRGGLLHNCEHTDAAKPRSTQGSLPT